ncbi:SWIM zinc finger family protein [Streptomyces thermolineatus]|uniref:SWIM zinc finger family protein n=2 Tax=Streptomyces TaxID=1883 RepID=A0ABP5ZVL4_9ACTN
MAGPSVTGMEERWTSEQVLGLAPDAASRKAGTKLSAPGPWSGTGGSTVPAGREGTVVWGLCRGSGSTPYRTVADLGGPAYKCSCPSRKFPCKHVLGLLLLWSAGPGGGVDPAEPPEWVAQWLSARAGAATRKAQRAAGKEGVADPEAARRRAELRDARTADGAAELEQRLADGVRAGLAGADRSDSRAWEEVAARMVDAQAPGLAARAGELAVVPSSGSGWPGRLLEEYALLHLLARGVRALDGLPEELAATVRSRAGRSVDSAGLLSTRAVRDDWLVLGSRDSASERLTTRRIWLRGARTGAAALVLSFGAAGRAPDLVLPVGMSVDADLAHHPAARPLRASLGERHAAPAPGPVPPGTTVAGALSAYGDALCDDPWLDSWPAVLAGVVPVPLDDGWQLADADGGDALPVDPGARGRAGLWRLAAVSGGRPVTVFGECGHRGFSPVTVWSGTEAVPL